MKKSVLKTTLGLFLSFWIISCGQKQENNANDDENYEESETIEDAEDTEEVLGISKFNLSANGQNYPWEEEITVDIEESTGFSLSKMSTDDPSVYIYTIRLVPMKDAVSISKDSNVTLYSNTNLENGNLESHFTILHTVDKIQDCIDNPQSCVGSGFAAYSNGDVEDETYISESGQVMISHFKITNRNDRFIFGEISGSYNFTGTNGMGTKNGQVKGTFENARFSMFK